MTQTLTATFQTSEGRIRLRLFPEQAPLTVRNFVELAEGGREWVDPRTGQRTTAKLYDGTVFHKTIPDFMIQGGDPLGNGSGTPGYLIPHEVHPELGFGRAGMLGMANSGRDRNGCQFFITTVPTPWLTGHYTVFGEVIEGQDVVERISEMGARPPAQQVPGIHVTMRDWPVEDVVLESVTIHRAEGR